MIDSTAVSGLLGRLDVVVAKLGVTADKLWALWVDTAWTAWIPVVLTVFFSLLLELGALGVLWHRNRRMRAYETAREANAWCERPDSEVHNLFSVFLVCVGAIVFAIGLGYMADAIKYTIQPNLYALDQLKALIDISR